MEEDLLHDSGMGEQEQLNPAACWRTDLHDATSCTLLPRAAPAGPRTIYSVNVYKQVCSKLWTREQAALAGYAMGRAREASQGLALGADDVAAITV